ncbi:MATE family efflux transporter [Pseudomonadales bacterium]|nr:MATE family efflux transporter [Pseudomonadales bacterium]
MPPFIGGKCTANYLHRIHIRNIGHIRSQLLMIFNTTNNHTNNSGIWSIAWPMILSGISIPMLGLVDTALLGHLDNARYLAAVAIGAHVIAILYWSFGFLRMSTTSLVSQSVGRGGQASKGFETDSIIYRTILMAAMLGIGLAVVVPWLIDPIVLLMNASNNIDDLAAEYIRIRLYSAPAALMTFAIAGWLIGLKKTKAALALVLLSNITNIILDAVFIVIMDMNSAGAAIASVIAEYAGLLLGLAFVAQYTKRVNFKNWRHWLSFNAYQQILGMNAHLFFRTLLLFFTFNFFTAQGASISDNVLAANAILLQLVFFSAYVMDGFSYAAEVLCGEATGSKQHANFQRSVKTCALWIAATALLFSASYLLMGEAIVSLLSDMPAILQLAEEYMIWLVLMPLAGMLAYLLDGVFVGAGNTRQMHTTMWFSVVIVFLPVWWLTQSWQNHGLWFAFICFTLARGFSLAAAYPALQRKI